jgi:hypothetical protein
MNISRKILTRIVIGLIGVIVIGLIINALIPRATIYFSVAPERVLVNINGKDQEIQNGQEVTVSPGEINVTISQADFTTYSESFTIENGEAREILIALDAETAAAELLLQTPGSQLVIQRIGGAAVEEGAEKLRQAYPIITELPINDRFYKIIVCESREFPNDSEKIAICVQLFDLQARQSAINTIERRGYSLDDYEVVFQDFTYENLQQQSGE